VRRGPIAVKRAGLRHTCVVYDAHTGPDLAGFAGRVSDLGEGRWTISAAIDEAVPAPVLSAALFDRFSSRGEAEFADRLLSAMRREFGGHVERRAPEQGAP
jgi:6-phosphogluconate dehydrogenase